MVRAMPARHRPAARPNGNKHHDGALRDAGAPVQARPDAGLGKQGRCRASAAIAAAACYAILMVGPDRNDGETCDLAQEKDAALLPAGHCLGETQPSVLSPFFVMAGRDVQVDGPGARHAQLPAASRPVGPDPSLLPSCKSTNLVE